MYLYIICTQESLHAATAVADLKAGAIFLVSAGLGAVIFIVQY